MAVPNGRYFSALFSVLLEFGVTIYKGTIAFVIVLGIIAYSVMITTT
jgi:hypothetical protein